MSITSYGVLAKKIEGRECYEARGNPTSRDIIKRHIKYIFDFTIKIANAPYSWPSVTLVNTHQL